MIRAIEMHLPDKILQSHHVRLSAMEAGFRVKVPRWHWQTYEHLKQFFAVNVTLSEEARHADAELSHKVPWVRIGRERRDLLYPSAMLDRCRGKWKENRSIEYLFIGNVTPEREAFFAEFPGAVIVESRKGRTMPEGAWDEAYFETLSRAKFVLCPSGIFKWTYRFFEAIFCGATPIVEAEADCYKGYYFHTLGDIEYEHRSMELNFEEARRRVTMPRDVLRRNL